MRTQGIDFFLIAKPLIMAMVALTALGGIYSSRLATPLPYALLVTAGIVLVAAGSAVFNNLLDRDIDRKMSRTRNRPLASGRMDPATAFLYGASLSVIGFCILLFFANFLSAALSLLGWLTYVGLYTAWLKRKTPFAVIPGGIAGALPPLIGACAATGKITMEGILLFAMMFIWQPAHFWYLALKAKDDYQRAGVPVLPLSHGEAYTRWHSLLYVICLLPVSIMPYGLGFASELYLFVAGSLTLCYVALNLYYFVIRPPGSPTRLFLFSILHLLVVFTALMVDKKV